MLTVIDNISVALVFLISVFVPCFHCSCHSLWTSVCWLPDLCLFYNFGFALCFRLFAFVYIKACSIYTYICFKPVPHYRGFNFATWQNTSLNHGYSSMEQCHNDYASIRVYQVQPVMFQQPLMALENGKKNS